MVMFKIRIEDGAIQDIQKGFEYYEEKQAGLGARFNREVFQALETLKSNLSLKSGTARLGVTL